MDRRDFLRLASSAGAASLFGLAGARPREPMVVATRFAFLTDVHLPESGRNAFVSQALRRLESRFGRHDFTVFGGDNVFDVHGKDITHAKPQFRNWNRTLASSGISSYSVLGNHDIPRWRGSDGDGTHEKQFAAGQLAMPNRYYTFSRAGWRFLMLDSVQKDDKFGYVGRIDDEQMSWLKRELGASPAPTVVVSHIPLLSASNLASREAVFSRNSTNVGHQRVVANNHEVLSLIAANPNVRLCLSGHLHMVDTVRYRHTKFVCGGALCGAWWKGEHEDFGRIGWSIELYANGHAKAFPLEFETKRVVVS